MDLMRSISKSYELKSSTPRGLISSFTNPSGWTGKQGLIRTLFELHHRTAPNNPVDISKCFKVFELITAGTATRFKGR